MTQPGASIAAVVPCAGRSSRMGTSKALLDAGGEPFVRRIVRVLLAGGAAPVVVVVREPDGPEASEALAAGAQVLVNPDPDHALRGGPISSLREGLRVVPDEAPGLLLHPVDHPRVAPGTVTALVDDFARHGAPITVPVWHGRRGHPVLFARALFAELAEPELAEGARSVVRRHRSARREVAVDDPGVVDDVDTPADYRRIFPSARGPGAPA